MPNCKEVSKIIAGDELEGAGPGMRLSVWFHLLMCKYCRRYSRQISAVGEVMRAIHARRPTPEEEVKLERMKEMLLNEDTNPPTA